MTKADGTFVEDLFISMTMTEIEMEKKTFEPYRDLVFRVDVEKCTELLP